MKIGPAQHYCKYKKIQRASSIFYQRSIDYHMSIFMYAIIPIEYAQTVNRNVVQQT